MDGKILLITILIVLVGGFFILIPEFFRSLKRYSGGIRIIPNLQGMDLDEAKKIVEELELEFYVSEIPIPSNDVEEGKIHSQDPRFGKMVFRGNGVIVFVAKK